MNSLDGLAPDAIDALFAPIVRATQPCDLCDRTPEGEVCAGCDGAGEVPVRELPPAWEALRREINSLPGLFGQAGVRDPDYPCAAFDPLLGGVERPSGTGHCHADGHYLCRECTQLNADSDNWPEEWSDAR